MKTPQDVGEEQHELIGEAPDGSRGEKKLKKASIRAASPPLSLSTEDRLELLCSRVQTQRNEDSPDTREQAEILSLVRNDMSSM